MPTFSENQREKLADKGQAMPSGGYPIRNRADLKRAIQAFGRAKDPVKTKAWIRKRARELDALDLLPDSWAEKVDATHMNSVDELLNSLAHYGVKGMHWGVRKKSSTGTVVTDRRGTPISKTNSRLNNDAVRTRVNQAIAKKSGTDVLSTKELQDLVTRLNLEKQYDQLNPVQKTAGQQAASILLTKVGPIALRTLGPKLADKLPQPYATAAKVAIEITSALAGAGKKK